MNKRSKLLPVWIVLSAAIVIAGIVLFVLFGFNTAPDRAESKTVDVSYNVVVELSDENKQALASASEAAFAENGVSFDEKLTLEGQAAPSGDSQGNFYADGNRFTLRYVFGADVSTEALNNAKAAIESAISALELGAAAEADVSVHTLSLQPQSEAVWRAAVAIASGAVVGLIYLGIRFGVGAALTGLTAAVHDVLLTLAFFAITRVPVYAFAPWLYAAIAAAASLGLWIVRCMKLRENGKDPSLAALPADEAVAEACRSTDIAVLAIAGCGLVALGIAAACMASGGAIVLAGALVPVAAAAYSAMAFAPALHVYVKRAFDRLRAKRRPRTGRRRAAREE